MTQPTDFLPPPPPPPPPFTRPPLRRSESDRVLAGVAGGFARWLGIDPVIVRVVLVVLAVFGGSGLILYLIGWAFIPADGAATTAAESFLGDARREGSTARTVLIVIGCVIAALVLIPMAAIGFGGWGDGGSLLLLLAAGGLVLYLVNRPPAAPLPGPAPAPAPGAMPVDDAAAADAAATTPYAYGGSGQYPGYQPVAVAPAPPKPPRPKSYLGLIALSLALAATGVLAALAATGTVSLAPVVIPAVALGILGAGVLVGAVVGRARWLLWFAVPTLMVTAVAALVPADFGSTLGKGIGERQWTPITAAAASAPHELGIGSARLDLSRLVLPAGGGTVPVTASVGIGELIVTVPAGARVHLDGEVGTGTIAVQGLPKQDGRPASVDAVLPGSPELGPVIDLTVHVSTGSLEVSRA